MAITKCKECEKEISTKAKSCPNCGAPFKKKSGFIKWLLIILFSLFLLGQLSDFNKIKRSNGINVNKVHSTLKNWNYSSNQDSLTGKTIHYATTKSLNTASFKFPYSGTQHASLTLRTHPQYKKDLIFQIEKGQFLCNSYNGCSVMIRFDNEKPVKYSANKPEDNSSETLFLNHYSKLAGKIMKSKKMFIQATFYNQGAHTFEFDIANFEVEKYRPSENDILSNEVNKPAKKRTQFSLADTKRHIKSAIKQCIKLPYGAKTESTIDINLKLNRDGRIVNANLIKNNELYKQDGTFRAAVSSTINAAYKCSPIKGLPVSHFEKWKSINIEFN